MTNSIMSALGIIGIIGIVLYYFIRIRLQTQKLKLINYHICVCN